MTVLSQTSTSVKIGGANTEIAIGQAGESLTPGNAAYLKSSDSKWYKSITTTAETSGYNTNKRLRPRLVLTPASTGEYFVGAISGPVNLGATLGVGKVYYVDDGTAGSISELSDLASGAYITQLCIADTTALANWAPDPRSVTVP